MFTTLVKYLLVEKTTNTKLTNATHLLQTLV